ncbi:hypothetical protein GCM10007938_16060 [Vibrio zhanjiangensis]|uniref:Uncharacterized protein n=2 Tax=Vibrio zhanjiangensis TaxID=1046128 RepID=A0ABQ6EXC9_9VIBR|nr:hypothetical protein GCM10007938_16060 [Vibrio zhanjiangensis]
MLPLLKAESNLYITKISNSIIQFNIDLNESKICFWTGEMDVSIDNSILEYTMRKMIPISLHTNVELVFDNQEISYSLRLRMSDYLGDTDAFSNAIDDLLWAHSLVHSLSDNNTCNHFHNFMKYMV